MNEDEKASARMKILKVAWLDGKREKILSLANQTGETKRKKEKETKERKKEEDRTDFPFHFRTASPLVVLLQS